MLASFRDFIRRSNPTGRAGLWLVYGILVAATWLVTQLGELVWYVGVASFHQIFRGSVVAILAKVTVAMILVGILATRVGMEILAANLITLATVPLVIVLFCGVIKAASRS